MRSVSRSAGVISSMDSLRAYGASFVKPQFSCIFACRKYWLMAVSSLVSCSLSSSITRASPCMRFLLGLRAAEASASRDGRDLQAVERIRRAQPVADPIQAVAAAGAGGAGVADL